MTPPTFNPSCSVCFPAFSQHFQPDLIWEVIYFNKSNLSVVTHLRKKIFTPKQPLIVKKFSGKFRAPLIPPHPKLKAELSIFMSCMKRNKKVYLYPDPVSAIEIDISHLIF